MPKFQVEIERKDVVIKRAVVKVNAESAEELTTKVLAKALKKGVLQPTWTEVPTGKIKRPRIRIVSAAPSVDAPVPEEVAAE